MSTNIGRVATLALLLPHLNAETTWEQEDNSVDET